MRALYSHWSDELARGATVTLESGTAEDTYGVDRLTDDNPAHLFKANETTVRLQFAFPVKQPIPLLALIHTTLEADDDVRFQGSDDADWYNPDLDLAITPSGWVGAGVTRWPVNTWRDLTQEEGYDPLGFYYYSLVFGQDTPLAQALQIGQIRFHPVIREFQVDRNMTETRDKPRIDNRTAFQVSTIYTRGTTIWRAQLGLSALFDAADERQAIQALWDDVDGGNRPWFFAPDATDPRGYLVRFATTEEQIQRVVHGVSNRPGTLEEVGRGLRPGV